MRFTHINNFEPKFYIGSASHHVLDESTVALGSTFSLPMTNLSKPEHQNLFVWAPILLFACHCDYRCLELALIQEWQPRLNYPFMCQFFHPKKGILKRPAMNTNAQFGLATLWRRARHRFTPKVIKDILASDPGTSSMILAPTPRPDSKP